MNFEQVKDYLLSFRFLGSICAAVLATVLILVLNKYTKKYIKHKSIIGKKATGVLAVETVIKYLIAIFAIVFVLQINGVNVSSLVTGLGVAGIIVGFALQDILKDLIMGANIMADGFFTVGDIVRYKQIEGKVVYFNIKVTKIKDVNTNNIFSVSNRNISEIEVLSDWQEILVPFGYDVDNEIIDKICNDIRLKAKDLKYVSKCDDFEVNNFCESYIQYRMLIHCRPDKKNPVRRAVNQVIKETFCENGIAFPYPQLDVHFDNKEK